MAIKINGATVIADTQAVTSTSTISATGNITGGNLTTGGTVSAVDMVASGTMSATGNISAGNISVSGIISGTVEGSFSAASLTGATLSSNVTGSSLTGVGTITTGTWAATDVAVAHGGTGASDAGTARTNLGLAIGTDVQAYNATLAAVAGGTYTGDDSITTVGTITTGTWAATDIAVAHGGTGASDAGTARTNLGLAIGTDVQAYNATLAAVAGGTYTGDDSITTVGTIGTGVWAATDIAVAHGGTGASNQADARTNLGLGTIATYTAGGSNGAATLDGSGTLTAAQIPASLIGAVVFQGTWNASTNTPTLTSATGTTGNYYVVSVAGSTDLDGTTDWKIGDWAIYSGTEWQKIDNTDSVTSVAGKTGAVTLVSSDVGLGSVENTAISTYAGTTSTTTVGTIGTGVWAATDVAVAHGGTGASDAGTARTNLGLAIGTDVQAYNATLAAVAGGTYSGDDSITTVGTIGTGTWAATDIAVLHGGTGASDAGTARTNLGLAIGTNVQAYNATLAAVAGGTYSGDDSITTVGTITTGTWAATDVAIAHGGTGASDAGTARTNLGLAIGTNVQAYNATLAAVAGGTYSGDDSITTVGTIGTGTWAATDIAVAHGGTGASDAGTALTNLGAYAASNPSGYVSSSGVTSIAAGSYLTGGTVTSTGTFAVDATSANTANKVVARDGSGNFSAGVVTATATAARYADLAENYVGDAAIEPGTVVEFGGDAEVTACAHDMCARVAGVVSTNPAYLMNNDLEAEHVIAVAFTGRVPCKVVGTVRKGDLMVSAGNGMARAEANPAPGTIIGKALADHDGAEGVIEVVVGRF